MSNDTQENNTSTQLDLFDVPLVIPVNRLDADQYSADDIDGVTESIFGSGNMAYANLQASQTDAAAALDDALNVEPGADHVSAREAALFSKNAGAGENTDADALNAQQKPDHDIPTDTDRALDADETTGAENIGSEGNFSHTTVGALGASTLSSDAGSFGSSLNLSLGGGGNFENSAGGSSSTVSTTINAVTNTVNEGDTINNVTNLGDELIENVVNLGDDVLNTVNETITNITDLGDQLIDNITNLGGDIINSILEGDITDITEILTNEVTQITEILNTEINNVVETVNNLLEETGITEITNQVTNITNNVTETVTNIIDDVLGDVLGGGLAINLDAGVLESLGIDLGVTIDDSIAGNIGTNLVSDNLSDVVGDLTGLDVPLISDTGVNIGFDLLGGTDPNDGNDISIAGLDTPDISLDLVEGIVGDIDIEIELPEELADPGALIENVGGIVENLDDLALADPEDILGILGGQGADGALEVIAGDTVLGEDFDLDVDSLLEDISAGADGGGLLEEIIEMAEDVVGGVESDLTDLLGSDLTDDLNIDDAIGMLGGSGGGDVAGGLEDALGDALGGILPDAPGWTESTITTGGMFDDIINGIGGESDSLPDPVGTVAEGLGVLDIPQNLDIGGLGGLFG